MAQAKKETLEFDLERLIAFLRRDELDYPSGANFFWRGGFTLAR
jgi:hypothetical protein